MNFTTAPQASPSSAKSQLFPEIMPFDAGYLDVGDGHELYWEQCGNPQGVPIMVLHGGPGGGCSARHRRFFNPKHYRIILFDQRGSGRSRPLGSIEENTPEALVKDINRLLTFFNIERTHVFGTSWGSTLALNWATQHPERCISMILGGIFLLSRAETQWLTHDIQNFFPDVWSRFVGFLPESKRDNILESYYDLLTKGSEEEQNKAALHWNAYESACTGPGAVIDPIVTEEQRQQVWAAARITVHYLLHNIYPESQTPLDRIDSIRDIPTQIIQGRCDFICPPVTAWKLQERWPEARFHLVPEGSHLTTDPSIRMRLIEATEHAKILLP